MEVDGREVRFRAFRPGDEAQIVDVYRASFDSFYPADKPVDEREYITWFAEPHESHNGWLILAEVDGRVTTVVGQLLRGIKAGPRMLYGTAGGIALATHPEFRGRGLSLGLEGWMADNWPRPYGASIERSRPDPTTERGRLASIPTIGVYVRVLRPWRAGGALRAVVHAGLALWGSVRSALSRGSAPLEVRTLPRFDERFGPFIDEVNESWDLIPDRPVEYLNWRFCDPRAGAFTVRAAEHSGELLGYAVLHQIGTRGHIADLLARDARPDVVRALVRDAVDHFDRAGAGAVECWMLRRHPYARALAQAGFVPMPRASREAGRELKIYLPGVDEDRRAAFESPAARIHVVRADVDGI